MRFFSNSTTVKSEDIQSAEERFGVVIPTALKEMVLNHNGATLENESNKVDSLISFSPTDIFNVYTKYELGDGYLPFADDGAEGCYALARTGEVVHSSSEGRKTVFAASFEEFIKLIDMP